MMSIVPSTSSDLTGPSGGTMSDVVGLILDKGLVIDAYVRVSLVGIEVLTVDARVVVASVDTYLRFAEAANRLDLEARRKPGLPDLVGGVTDGLTGLIQGERPAEPAGELGPAEDPAAVPGAASQPTPARDDAGEAPARVDDLARRRKEAER
jgi:gas vesicle structural protein